MDPFEFFIAGDMPSFIGALISQAGGQQYTEFIDKLKKYETINRRQFLVLYLSTFLHEFDDDTILTIDEEQFENECHDLIDSINICENESEYFHIMVDFQLDGNENYIEEWIRLFHSDKELIMCQLGPTMLKCLEASKHRMIFE